MKLKSHQLKAKKRKGFSLVELVVVMAIIGILIVAMAPNYKGFIDDARGVGVKADARILQTMITLVEVYDPIDPDNTVASLATSLSGKGTEVKTLKAFITELEGKASALIGVKISELPEIVKTGEIPTP